jgi:hypothetical protein
MRIIPWTHPRGSETLMLLKNILGDRGISCQSFSDSMNLREVLTPFAAFLRGLLTQKKENW